MIFALQAYQSLNLYASDLFASLFISVYEYF
jgi:hypothetical protein